MGGHSPLSPAVGGLVRLPGGRRRAQVIEVQRPFGEPDYLIRVVSADLEAYQRRYESVLVRLPGVTGLTSTIVMKQAVPLRPFPTG